MPKYFDDLEELKRFCYVYHDLEAQLSSRYGSAHPWLFKDAFQDYIDQKRFVVTYRNYDGSRHLTVSFQQQGKQALILGCIES